MHATNTAAGDQAWDGSYKHRQPPRFLRVAPDSPIPLHPHELPAAAVPPHQRWHIDTGIAHPAGDGSPWCRVRHRAVCPATPADAEPAGSRLGAVRRSLALISRRLQGTGHFTPPPPRTGPPTPDTAAPKARPVVQLLCPRYLAPGPLEQIPCVAQTRARPALGPGADAFPGTWALAPLHHDHAPGHLRLAEVWLAHHDMTHLPHSEQLRWRAQRCIAHATALDTADMARTTWKLFNPRTHHEHIRHHLAASPHSACQGRV